jgi:hypothetical protein
MFGLESGPGPGAVGRGQAAGNKGGLRERRDGMTQHPKGGVVQVASLRLDRSCMPPLASFAGLRSLALAAVFLATGFLVLMVLVVGSGTWNAHGYTEGCCARKMAGAWELFRATAVRKENHGRSASSCARRAAAPPRGRKARPAASRRSTRVELMGPGARGKLRQSVAPEGGDFRERLASLDRLQSGVIAEQAGHLLELQLLAVEPV